MRLVMFFTGILLTSSAMAQMDNSIIDSEASNTIRLDSLYQKLDNQQNYKDVRVYNDSKNLAFVSVSAVEVMNPGAKEEHVKETDFGNGPLISTKALMIPAESSRSVRVYYPETISRDADRFFRIRFTPVMPTKEHGFTDSQLKSAKTVESNFKLSFAWGGLLAVVKNSPNLDYKVHLEASNNLVFENTGDSLVTIKYLSLCSEDNQCKNITAKPFRVLSKQSKKIPISEFIKQNPKMNRIDIQEDSLPLKSINLVK
ncbi:putative fimbrial protein TcfA [Vibrio cholerae]|uniref:Putative fimbrial protein TcfA n=1 Tax=Vibrio cholerae TaxID=666 RepID=A0A655X3P7_VIBCL|nr:putative fimbrial protein TcfA [Vibrio cholerae]